MTVDQLEINDTILPEELSFDFPRTAQVSDHRILGKAAVDFEVETLDGQSFRLSEQRGNTVLLYFWATSYGPCLAETPKRKELYEQLSARYNRLVMLGLSMDESEAEPLRHVQRHGESWPHAHIGPDSPISASLKVRGAGYYVIVTPTGHISRMSANLQEVRNVLSAVLTSAN